LRGGEGEFFGGEGRIESNHTISDFVLGDHGAPRCIAIFTVVWVRVA
jgi:hypothetical protein